jgi:hypothetical protein
MDLAIDVSYWIQVLVGSSSMTNSPVNFSMDLTMVSVGFAMCLMHLPLDPLLIDRAHCG